MKKVLVMCILMALVVAGSASANYIWKFAATNDAGGNFGTAPQWGTVSTSTANQSWTVSSAAYAAIVLLDDVANPGTSTKSKLLSKDLSATDRSKVYIQVWGADAYTPNTIDFRMWVSLDMDPAPKAAPMKVKCIYDPLGTLTGQTLLSNVSTALGSQDAPKGKTSLATYRTSTPFAAGNGYILEVSTVPEPGSMIAMLSGLVGLVGFGIRRRK